jgi:hypothetical protein
MCTHIQYTGSQNTTIQWYYYVFYIIVQNTTCFGLYSSSSGCWENLNREYIKGVVGLWLVGGDEISPYYILWGGG